MNRAERPPVSYFTIWVWLVILIAVGLLFVALPISKLAAVAVIFTAATIKAGLVVRHYMHLRAQPVMLYAIAGVPVMLAVFMVLALVPDIAWRP